MYLEYFGLLETPFSIAPDPRYLYMSERHREALAHLLYGMDSDGAFILLTGEVGTGKTTVSRCLLEQVPEDTNMALVLNPKLNAIELLQVICDELGIRYDTTQLSVKSLVDLINHYLLDTHAQGKKTVVLIEEAQNLDLDVLEQLRLLTNLETSERKLLQVILLGQPEFLDVLDRPELSQLAQRITARFHLTPLSLKEVEEYIGHRLAIAGCRRPLFAPGVIKQIYHYSGGVPRLINVICDRALLGCYVQNLPQIDKTTLTKSAREVLGENKADAVKSTKAFTLPRFFSLAALLIVLLAAGLYFSNFDMSQFSHVSAEISEAALEKQLTMPLAEIKPTEQVFIQWPSGDQRLRSNLSAYQALFDRWQLSFQVSSDGTPCFYAKTQGLSCWHGLGDISELRKLNRPAVLKLYDDFNQPQYITLIELGAKTARIEIAQKQQAISLEQLLFYWKGEYSLLWRLPPGYQQVIRPGSDGEAVVWLSKVLNEINKQPDGLTSSYYDAELLGKVKEFQLSQGLDNDGVVGVKTLIHINQAMGQGSPVLETSS